MFNSKREFHSKGSSALWEDKKSGPKREKLPRQTHKEQQQLRTLAQIYGRSPLPLEDNDELPGVEDFWA